MQTKYIIVSFLIIVLLITTDSLNKFTFSNAGGAPVRHAGAPNDNSGLTCGKSGCHFGSTTPVSGWITSNVDPGGYFSDSTYTVTVKAVFVGRQRFGFEATPQDGQGNLMGTLGAIGNKHKLIGLNKYVTHTSLGINSVDSNSWTFNWTPPIIGSGTATFYGAMNCANSNGSTSGDIIFSSQLAIPENPANATGIALARTYEQGFSIYPNPFNTSAKIKLPVGWTGGKLFMYDLRGQLIRELALNQADAIVRRGSLSNGMYFYQLHGDDGVIYSGKLAIN